MKLGADDADSADIFQPIREIPRNPRLNIKKKRRAGSVLAIRFFCFFERKKVPGYNMRGRFSLPQR